MMILVVKRHITYPIGTGFVVSSCSICAQGCFIEEGGEIASRFMYTLFTCVLATILYNITVR